MFRNQIPELPNFAAVDYAPVKADLTNAVPHLYPSSSPQGWGLTFMVTGGERNWSLTRDCALGWAPELLVVV